MYTGYLPPASPLGAYSFSFEIADTDDVAIDLDGVTVTLSGTRSSTAIRTLTLSDAVTYEDGWLEFTLGGDVMSCLPQGACRVSIVLDIDGTPIALLDAILPVERA